MRSKKNGPNNLKKISHGYSLRSNKNNKSDISSNGVDKSLKLVGSKNGRNKKSNTSTRDPYNLRSNRNKQINTSLNILSNSNGIENNDVDPTVNIDTNNPNDLQKILANIKSSNPSIQLQAMTCARKLNVNGGASEEMIKLGFLPVLVNVLKDTSSSDEVKLETLWILINIAAGPTEHSQEVIKAGTVTQALELLSSSNMQICELAVWVLGNIIGDGANARDYCVALGIVEPLLKFIESKDLPVALLKEVAWLFINLCRIGNAPLSHDDVKLLLPALIKLLNHKESVIVSKAVWSIFYLTENENDDMIMELIIDSNVLSTLILLIDNVDTYTKKNVLGSIKNIVTKDKKQIQVILNNDFLKFIPGLLCHSNKDIVKETVLIISLILSGGTQSQKQSVIDANLLEHLIPLLTQNEFKTQCEVLKIIKNMDVSKNSAQILKLSSSDGILALCSFLAISDTQSVNIALELIWCVLEELGDNASRVCKIIEKCDGLDKIDNLQKSKDKDVQKMANKIVKTYFN